MKLFRRNQKGFTLIEAMISLGVSAIGTLALLGTIEIALKAQRNVASLTDFDTFQNQLKMFVGNPALCSKALVGPSGGLKVPSLNVTSLNLAGEVVQVGTRLTSGSTITGISMSMVGASPVANQYSTYLKITGTKNVYASGPAPLAEINLPVTLQTDASGKVTSCYLGADPAGLDYNTLCTQMFHGTVVNDARGNYCIPPGPPKGPEMAVITCSFPAGVTGWETCSCPNQNPNVTGWSGSNCQQGAPGVRGCFQSVGTSKSVTVYVDGTSASTVSLYCKI